MYASIAFFLLEEIHAKIINEFENFYKLFCTSTNVIYNTYHILSFLRSQSSLKCTLDFVLSFSEIIY